MKSRVVCLFILVALSLPSFRIAVASEQAPAPNPHVNDLVLGNNEFALDLYAKLSQQEDGNLLMSPYGISTALAMTFAGARGDTETEMAKVLHFDLPQDQLHPAFAAIIRRMNQGDDRPYQLSVANRLWGQKDYKFLPEFLATTNKHYGAELATVDFARQTEPTRQAINRWVEERTQDKIKDLIPSDVLDSLTRLVLTNAIYFKGSWKYEFEERRTRDLPFTLSAENKVDVATMFQKNKFKYTQQPGVQVLEMPYSGDELSLVVLLPEKADGLAELEESLSTKKLAVLTSGLRETEVSVFLPKFKMTCDFDLSRTLASMGMPLAFSRKADFSGMTGVTDLYISAVLHKAFIDVNEEGTEAAAATAVVMTRKGAAIRPNPIFRADRPFLFLLKDTETNSILFIGRVMDPRTE
jgi:serpin B